MTPRRARGSALVVAALAPAVAVVGAASGCGRIDEAPSYGDASVPAPSEAAAPDAGNPADAATDVASTPPPRPRVRTTPTKVAQLIGDVDREYSPPTATMNRTATRYGLEGTDLGASFTHAGKLYFVFGDTLPVNPDDPLRKGAVDAIATAGATFDPTSTTSGVPLDFLTASDGDYLPVTLDGATLGTLSVPMSGFSDGARMYVFFALGGHRSLLGVSDDDGRSFTSVAEVPSDLTGTDRVVNVFPRVVATTEVPGLGAPWTSAKTVLVFTRRSGEPFTVAAAPLDGVADTTRWLWFHGFGAGGAATWGSGRAGAAALFPTVDASKCNGNFSFTWLPGIDRWINLDHCDGPNAVLYRTARDFVGPWSDERVLFERDADGICRFIHRACSPGTCCDDDVEAPVPDGHGGELFGLGGEGYVYAPFPVDPTVRYDAANDRVDFLMLMSVFNPYTPMVMHVRIERADVPF